MKRNFNRKTCWLVMTIALIFLCSSVQAQRNKKIGRNRQSKFQEKFLNKQFWVGFRAGGNITKANPLERYSAFTTTGGDQNIFNKQYENFSYKSGQAGLVVTFYYRRFSVSFQPGYRRMTFGYTNDYNWTDPSNSSNTFDQHYDAVQKLDYLEFPLYFRYEPLKTRLKPFVQAGWYYGTLNNALKRTTITTTDQASGGSDSYIAEEISVEARDLFIRSNMGWSIGTGVSYPLGNARLFVEFNYIRNTHNITSVANRYSNERLTGSGDILDDVNVRNMSVAFAVVIPLRFVILKENYKVE